MNNMEDFISETMTKIFNTADDVVIEACLPFAQSVKMQISKEELRKAIEKYYAKEDVVKIVRCKDCAYRDKFVDEFGVAKYFCGYFCGSQKTDPNGYCYRGRKPAIIE